MLISAYPAMAQEIYFHDGISRRSSSQSRGYAWGLTYLEGLGENAAWSFTYLNEGHNTDHRRDGLSPQVWGRLNVFGRQVSLAAGAGPYIYHDSVSSTAEANASIEHGVGSIMSLAATLYSENRFLLQLRANYIWTHQNADVYVVTFGVGYQLGRSPSVGPLQGYSRDSHQATPMILNQITLYSGVSILNREDADTLALGLEYRRRLTRNCEWTIGWLNEGPSVSRTGPITQIWIDRSFLNDRLSLGFGMGPYLAHSTRGNRNTTRVNILAGGTIAYRILPEWSIRFLWTRITADDESDADVMMTGVGYHF